MVLEYKDVQGFSLKVNKLSDSTEVELSGLAFHSSLAVKEMKTEIAGQKLIVKIILVEARKGLSGRFALSKVQP